MKKYFIDTNLIIYANDRRDPDKQDKAIHLLKDLLQNNSGVVSTQVLQEYSNVALTKLRQRQDIVLRQITLLESFDVVLLKPALIKRAIEIRSSYTLNFWNSCIISAAESAQCDVLYSEDLNAGQFYSGIRLVNPLI